MCQEGTTSEYEEQMSMEGEPPPFHSLAMLSWVGH